MAGAPLLLDRLDGRGRRALRRRCARCLDAADLTYEIDPTLVRGLDYYTRTVFEFTSDALGAQSGVGGGGRYDGLIEQLGGAPTPGVGFAAGVERMLLASAEQPVAPPAGRPLRRDRQARAPRRRLPPRRRRRAASGLAVQLELAGRSLKGQLKQAERLGARYVAILGDEEAALKDMDSGEQRELPLAGVISAVQRGMM